MEFEDQEERQEEEEGEEEEEEEEEEEDEEEAIGLPGVASYHSSGVKMIISSGPEQQTAAALAASHHPVVVGGHPVTTTEPRYRECMKNHAVGMGGHAVDGCGEFLPAGAEGTLDALKCAACNCHRNFHRKEFNTTPGRRELFFHNHQVPPQFTPYYRAPTQTPPSGFLQVGLPHQHQQHRPLALPSTAAAAGGGGGGQQMMVIDQEDASNPMSSGGGSTRKRFRTKFTQEQKERMFGLAERLGWRIQKHDEDVVQQFCNETGVKRHVLKVWMHNNKHTLGKKP